MATNLVSLIMNFLTPDMIGRLASKLGLERNDTSSAIEAGVPGLLAALMGVANRPGGPQRLADAAKQEVGTLDKFTSMLGTTGQNSLVDRGSRRLRSQVRSANIPALERPRAARCLPAWARLSWARLPSSKVPALSMAAASPAFSQARKTTSLRRFPRGLASCSAARACSTRLTTQHGEQLRQVPRRHELPPRR